MKFKFCWDCDCPDWVLAEIVAMSKRTHDDFQPLLILAVNSILGKDSVTEELEKWSLKSTGHDNTLILAAIRWILESAASSSTAHTVLSSELLQLGLRKDHSSVFVDQYRQNTEAIQRILKDQSLKVSKDLKFDYEIMEVQMGARKEPIAEIKVTGDIYEQGRTPVTHKQLVFNMTKEQASALLYEISEAEKVMEELTPVED